MKWYSLIVYGLVLNSLIGLCLFTAGCPAVNGEGSVTLLFTGDRETKSEEVSVDLIQSFTVEITKITLKQGLAQAVVFEGSQDADLIDLSGISSLLSSTMIGAGTYTKIELEIANPRLVLKADPETTLTNIQLTANSRMFVSGTFTVPEEGNVVIRLDFGGIHLVPASDKYVLTPQLRADVITETATVKNEGTIISINTDTSTLILSLPSGNAEVIYSSATITLVGSGETPDAQGSPTDLVVGKWIQVEGTVNTDGVITATSINIAPTP